MKLSKETLEVLNNFAAINGNLVVGGDDYIRTVTTGKNLMGRAKVDEDFPYKFGIYDMNQFLGAYGIFEDPELSFSDDQTHLTMREGDQSIRYNFSAVENLVTVEKDVTMPECEVMFTITDKQLNSIRKASSVLAANDLIVTRDGDSLVCTVGDTKNSACNEYVAKLETFDINTTEEFMFVFDIQNFKFKQSDEYQFAVSSKLISSITTPTITYWMAQKKTSKFGA